MRNSHLNELLIKSQSKRGTVMVDQQQHLQRLDTVERRVDRNETRVDEAFERISAAMQEISGTLKELSIVAHEQIAVSRSVERAFIEIAEVKKDVKAVEGDVVDIKISMPGLKEKTGWITKALIGAGAILLLAMMALVLKAPISG